MSRPNYLKKSTLSSSYNIITTVEELVSYIFTITNNERQFPKAYRYTLISEIRLTALKLNKHIYRAASYSTKALSDYERIRTEQERPYDLLIDLKSLIVISMTILNLRNPEHLGKLFDSTVTVFNKWIKNTKRAQKKAIYEASLTPEQILQKKEARLTRIAKSMKHGQDGFVELTRALPAGQTGL